MGAVAEVAAAIERGAVGRHLLLLSDFDGTLCEFSVDPEAVRLPAARGRLLDELAGRPDVTVGIVSGRRLADLRSRLNIRARIYLAGLHGLEIEGPGVEFLHPGAARARAALHALEPALARAVADLPGVFIEHKDLSLALHMRGAEPAARARAEARLTELARPELDRGVLRLLPGDCVVELLPQVAWSKGDAVRWLRGFVERESGRRAWPVYLGDDVTDEAAFEAIGEDGVTVVVGGRPSRARFRLAGPGEVEALLADLVARGVGGAPGT